MQQLGQDTNAYFFKYSLSSSPQLYSFANNTTASPRNNSMSINVDNLVIWQYRLGHSNLRAVIQLLKLCNIHFNNKNSEIFCHACCLGKSHSFYSNLTHTKYIIAFELVHTDLWGVITNSI